MPCRAYQVYDEKYIKDRVIVTASDCWEWQRSRNPSGYGVVNRRSCGESNAYRLSYSIFKGPIPLGMYVCHSCDNPPCVNPDHLFLGSMADNIKDAINKGRHKHLDTSAATQAKSIPQHVVEDIINRVNKGERKTDIARLHKVHITSIYNIIKRKV